MKNGQASPDRVFTTQGLCRSSTNLREGLLSIFNSNIQKPQGGGRAFSFADSAPEREKRMSGVRRVYVEKKEPFAVSARQLKDDIEGFLGIEKIKGVRILIRYDVENISDETFEKGCRSVFSEPPVDILYREKIEVPAGTSVFSVEALPGQFDQRADSAEQCLQFLNEEEKPVVRTAVTYLLEGELTGEDVERIKAYCINPVDSRETGMDKPATLRMDYPEPDDVQVFTGFTDMEAGELKELYESLSEEEKGILTDACKIFSMKGCPVRLIRGEVHNIKITYPYDLRVAKALLDEEIK